MSTDDDLARLRVAIETGYLPRDLGIWALRRLTPSADRRRRRDAYLRTAASRLTGSRWSRAVEIHAMLGRLRAEPGVAGYLDTDISEAFTIDPEAPRSLRHILAIIE